MQNKIGKRVIISICFFWLGFQLIGLSIWLNGWAYSGNIIWNLFQKVCQVEFFILKFSIALFFIALLMAFIHGIYSPQSTKSMKSEEIIVPASAKIYSSNENRSLLQVDNKPANPKVEPTVNRPLEPNPPPLTSAELKRRALKQITGKEYFDR